MFNSFRLYGLQHKWLPCPSLSPGVHANSCPLSQWCYLTISSSAAPFSFCLQSLSASGSSQIREHYTWNWGDNLSWGPAYILIVKQIRYLTVWGYSMRVREKYDSGFLVWLIRKVTQCLVCLPEKLRAIYRDWEDWRKQVYKGGWATSQIWFQIF